MRARWRTAGAATVATFLAVSGCENEVSSEAQQTRTPVEVFSWWTADAQSEGLDALVEEFEEANPDTRFVNPAAQEETGEEAQELLERRLVEEDPPDSFQSPAGAGLSRHIEEDRLEPLDEFYDNNNLIDVFPEQLIEQLRYRGAVPHDEQGAGEEAEEGGEAKEQELGSFYSVPVSIHRSNLLWYNPSVLDEAGVDGALSNLDEVLEALEAVEEETDAVPLALGPQWTVDHLLENVLLSTLGVEEYNALWGPEADWDTPEVGEALETFADLLAYAEAGEEGEGWQEPAERVVDGSAAFYVMGDWTFGLYEEMGLVPREDYGWVPTPGTDGVYLWFADSFTLPRDTPNEEGALAWLEFVVSREGQDVVNPPQGSIPVRTDSDIEPYTESEYLSWALAQWQEADLAGSFWHGASASGHWRDGIDIALGDYLADGDLEEFQENLDAVAQDASGDLIGADANDDGED